MTELILTLGRLNVGGAEKRTLRLLQEIRRRGAPISTTLFVTSGMPGTLDEQFRAAGASLVYGTPDIKGLLQFYHVCRSRSADVVHVSAALAAGFYCMSAYFAGVPIRIAHIRSTAYNRSGFLFALRNSVYRAFLNVFSTSVVGVCNAANLLSQTPKEKWLTIYNGVDAIYEPADRRMMFPEKVLNILFLARMRPEKNPLKALRILAAVRALAPERNAHLHFVGDETIEMAGAARSEIRKLGLQDAVTFHGRADEPSALLRSASILLVTSTREGLPGVVLEALSVGTPVVASDLPGVREIAAACPGISIVNLRESDEEWARAILADAGADRPGIVEAFKRSPFTFERQYQEMIKLWTGEQLRRHDGV